MVNVTEGELKDAEWWLGYWKRNTEWLITRMEQMMAGEDVSGMVNATIPFLKRELGGLYGHR